MSVPADPQLPRVSTGRSSTLRPGEPVIGYVAAWPPPDGQDAAAAIGVAVTERELRLVEVIRERDTGVRSLDRPGLSSTLRRIAAGEASALVVGDLRNLCRSIVDLGSLLRWFAGTPGELIALDLRLDTTTREGQAVAEAIVKLSSWEHERIAQRTRTGLARVRAGGGPIGPPAVADAPALRQRVAAMRSADMTLQAIADTLNREGIPTVRGGARWRPSSVQSVLGYRRPRKVG